MLQAQIIKTLKNILGTFAYEYGTDSQSYKELEDFVTDLGEDEALNIESLDEKEQENKTDEKKSEEAKVPVVNHKRNKRR